MKRSIQACLGLAAFVLSFATLAGCEQRTLFSDRDAIYSRKIACTRDQESVEAERERRKTNTELGFGMTQGAAPQ